MPADREKLAALTGEIGRFYVRGRALQRAQQSMQRALAQGEPSQDDVAAYLKAVRKYFSAFAREARTHLSDVERRLAHVSQVQYNLSAERGVAAQRVEATQGVLSRVEEIGAE